MSNLPPWSPHHLREPVQLDQEGVIDVSQFVRFEMHFTDIDYGVLDVAVTFHSEGQLVHMYLLHYFALAERHDKNSCLYDGWQDMFDFPPALQKLVVTHQGRTIQLFQQQCIAINDKGISVYGPNKALRRRLIHHVVYHERPLLEAWQAVAPSLSREPFGHPQTTWQWARPEGINPRQANRWVLRDQARLAFGHPPVAAGSQDLGQGYPTPFETPAHRQVTREHHRVDTAMFQRVQGMIASLQALEPLLRQVPAEVRAQMIEPASDLHADLNGLLFTAFLFANIHPNADDYDVG